MTMWWKRRRTQPREVVIQHRGLEVSHVIERKPDPRPIMCWLLCSNDQGQQFRTSPVNISGRSSTTIVIPVDWLGTIVPHSQIQLRLELDY
jgi:hypothetical protein